MAIYPPYLQKGNTIGITCPAGFMEASKAEACIQTLQLWGYQVMVGKTLGSRSKNYFSASDEDRRNEVQAMLDDPGIHAILFGRGGYGMGRIIDQLDFKKFRKNPKWIIGFSDITVMHNHILSRYGIASIHGPMAAAFNNGSVTPESISSLKKIITGKKNSYSAPAHLLNKTGKATGMLVGGNLALLANITGTPSDMKTNGCILFIEDIGEYLYNADRMLYQLKRSGKFAAITGLIIGGFTDMKDTTRPFGKNIEQLIADIIAGYDIPVCYGFPISHGNENVAVKTGGRYELTVSNRITRLKEI